MSVVLTAAWYCSLVVSVLSNHRCVHVSSSPPNDIYNMNPYHYTIRLTVNMSMSALPTYESRTDISFYACRSTRSICFHYVGNIRHAHLYSLYRKGGPMVADVIKISKSGPLVCLHFAAVIPRGKSSVLSISHSGSLGTNLTGLYRSVYVWPNGDVERYMVTQLQPSFARFVFPCVDDPAYKARFSMVLTYDASFHSLSNEVLMSRTQTGNLITDTYATTPIMSTYLVGIFVSRFKCVQRQSKEGVHIRIWTPEPLLPHAEFAVTTSTVLFDWFQSTLKAPFPLKKMDMVATPHLLFAGMENWGLVTLRMDTVLFKSDAEVTKKITATRLLAHEIAHNWFGNLITAHTWKEVWIQEGFSRFFEYYAVDQIHPEWRSMETFIVMEHMQVLWTEVSATLQPLVGVAGIDFDSLFTLSMYRKGACVMRMLMAFLGKESFLASISDFLKNNALSSFTRADLWSSISSASGINISVAMENWVVYNGVPLVELTGSVVSVRDYLFLAGKRDIQLHWSVPLVLRIFWANGSASDMKILLTGQPLSLPVGQNDVVLLNSHHQGYYISRYDKRMLGLIAELLTTRYSTMTSIERAGLVMDSLLMIEDGLISDSDVYSLFGYLHDESFLLLKDVLINSARWSRPNGHVRRFLMSFLVRWKNTTKVENNTRNSTPRGHAYPMRTTTHSP